MFFEVGKHRNHTAGWALDVGTHKKRLVEGKRQYGKHGVAHAGLPESKPEAQITAAIRYLKNKPINGKHGALK